MTSQTIITAIVAAIRRGLRFEDSVIQVAEPKIARKNGSRLKELRPKSKPKLQTP